MRTYPKINPIRKLESDQWYRSVFSLSVNGKLTSQDLAAKELKMDPSELTDLRNHLCTAVNKRLKPIK